MGKEPRSLVPDLSLSSLLIILGGFVILTGVALGLLQRLRPAPPDPGLAEQFRVEMEQMPTPLLRSTLTPEPIPASPTVLAPTSYPTATPTPEPFVIEGVQYSEGTTIEMFFHVPRDTTEMMEIPDFKVYSWHPDIFDDPDFFKPGDGAVVSYMDNAGRVGLWAHSGGRKTTMYPLQTYLEKNLTDNPAPLESMAVTTALKDSNVDIFIDDEYASFMKVAAAIRVPPMEVPELIEHTMDIIPYLAQNYSFDFQSLIHDQQVVFLYFCGLALEGEERNPEANKWTQARFVVALTSAWEGR